VIRHPPIRGRDWLVALVSAAALLWINAYICRDLFRNPTAYMNSMHGFWIAMAKHGGVSWFQSHWWPYWDGGMPTEFTYAPLVPSLISAIVAATGIPHIVAFQWISGAAYCLTPVTLFVMAWQLTRAPLSAFLAGLFYSLCSPTQLIVPDAAFSWATLRDPRRLYIVTIWDDTPHLVALALLPLVILLLWKTLETRRVRYFIPAVIFIALMALASTFGPIDVVVAAFSMLFVFPRSEWRRNVAAVAGFGILGYALCAPFLPPSLFRAISAASAGGGVDDVSGAFTAAAIIAAGWVVLWHYLPRWTTDTRLQFFVLFGYLTSSVPVIAAYLHRQFLPQPGRYKVEMEMGLALLIVFALRPLFERAPRTWQAVLLVLLLALAGEQIVNYRRWAKAAAQPRGMTQTIEYRASLWAEQNLGGTRVMLPGSIGQWANAFTDVVQFAGGSWSQALNRAQQEGDAAIYYGGSTMEEARRIALAWLTAYGVGAVAVSGPKSEEFWKRYTHTDKFDGVLPVLWSQNDVTFYRVPQKSASLAHVVPRAAIVRSMPIYGGDIAAVERYVGALEDTTLPNAGLLWDGRDRASIRLAAAESRVLSIQVNYHPGWHASRDGKPLQLHKDGLGLMWLEPDCAGPCEILLDYDGGWELRICRSISAAALLTLALLPFLARRRAA